MPAHAPRAFVCLRFDGMGAAVSKSQYAYALGQEPLVIVGHQGILRVIYAFFMDLPRCVRSPAVIRIAAGFLPVRVRRRLCSEGSLSAEPFPDRPLTPTALGWPLSAQPRRTAPRATTAPVPLWLRCVRHSAVARCSRSSPSVAVTRPDPQVPGRCA